MKNLLNFEGDAAKLLSIIFIGAALTSVVKSACLTVFAIMESKNNRPVDLKL